MLNYYPLFDVSDTSTEEVTYLFTTNQNIDYLVKFSSASFIFKNSKVDCRSIVDISFFPEDKNKQGSFDPKIKETIIQAIVIFLIKKETPLLYICDSTDEKERGRIKLFNRWFKESPESEKYKHGYRTFQFENYSLIIGIIAPVWDANFEQYFNEIDLGLFG